MPRPSPTRQPTPQLAGGRMQPTPRFARPSLPVALVAATLVLGIVLRLWLALVNAEANDPHLPVIRIIAFEHRFPAWGEAWEAFQPKLYHTTVAMVWRAMGADSSLLALARAAQLVSCAAGVLTLLVVLRFLRERAFPATAQAVAFALVALSPGLVRSSAQATNDAFVILFASLTLCSGTRYFARARGIDFLALCAAAVLAGISKGNGLVVIVAVLATFAIVFVRPGSAPRAGRRVVLAHAAAFALLVVPAVALIGPYATFQRQFGTPFITNWPPSPPPHLYRETVSQRPGLTSLAHGLLTFRLADLLRHPGSTYDPSRYPRHRTSLPSRVYAQTFSMRFENWPPSWATTSPAIRQLTRLLFLLGLVPAAMLLVGAATVVRDTVRAARRDAVHERGAPDAWGADVLLVVAAAGYLAFVVLYAVRLRDYSSMKQIFILPALLSFAAFAAAGVARLRVWAAGRRPGALLRATATVSIALLLLAHTVDIGLLIRDLGAQPQRPNDHDPRPIPLPAQRPPGAT